MDATNSSGNSPSFAVQAGQTKLDARSKDLRRTILKMVEAGRRGHIPSAFSPMEVLRILYDEVLRFDPKRPFWNQRDRCILSKGHGCLALYVLLAEKGFFPASELLNYCKSNGILGGHPERSKVPGVEASTGSLGHGLPIGLGMALAARHDKTGARTFVIMGDGEQNEGSVWEAAMVASKHRLANLTAITDYNKRMTYDSTYVVQDLEPLAAKWSSFGFEVREVNGHDLDALRAAFRALPFHPEKPSQLICHTVKGKGIPLLEADPGWHHKPKISDDDLKILTQGLEAS
jgi:transketolase